jgi:hypothetical protein
MDSKLSNGEALAAKRRGLVLLVLNFIGAIIYEIAASHGWVISQEREFHSVTGEPYVWAFYVFPIWAVFLLLNLVWGAFVVARRQWRSGLWWLTAIQIWLVAMAIDFAHH